MSRVPLGAETAHPAGDRFRLWTGLLAYDCLGDNWLARVGPDRRGD